MPTPDEPLISIDDLKSELRITHSYEDERLDRLAVQATALVLDYLEANDMVTGSPPDWTDATVPLHVQSAILQAACNLYRHSGDAGEEDGPITKRVKNILERERTPIVR